MYKTKSQIFQILEAAVAVPPISITARPGVPLFHINALIYDIVVEDHPPIRPDIIALA